MFDNNLNEKVLEKEEILNVDSFSDDILSPENQLAKENETLKNEKLGDTTIFTPIVSDGIVEEILELEENDENNINVDFLNNEVIVDNNDIDVLENNMLNNDVFVVDDNLNTIINNEINETIDIEKGDERIAENNNADELKLPLEENEYSNFAIGNEESVNNNFESIEENKNDSTKLEQLNNDDNNIEKEKTDTNVNEFVPNISIEENEYSNFAIGNEESINNNFESIEENKNDSTKLDQLNNDDNNMEKEKTEDTLLDKYGENFSVKEYVCNPAIGRDDEIKQLILTLLTPEKSGILVGKPGIGKTAIVEGLGYQIQKGNVPDALKQYQIYKLNTSSLLGIMPGTNEPKIQVLLNEIKGKNKLILFIDEIHTLIGAGADGDDSLDFANIFKPGLDRGNIKIIGATTSDEYDKYILTDKAFVRRFQKIEVLEPTKEHTVKIMMGSLPKLEKKTGVKLKYTTFIQEKIMTFIVDLTSEYRRVYELSARYPDVSLTILQQAFSYAVFDNKKEVSIRDVRKAISNTKLVYSDVIKKELVRFNDVFSDIYLMETPQRLKGETSI